MMATRLKYVPVPSATATVDGVWRTLKIDLPEHGQLLGVIERHEGTCLIVLQDDADFEVERQIAWVHNIGQTSLKFDNLRFIGKSSSHGMYPSYYFEVLTGRSS